MKTCFELMQQCVNSDNWPLNTSDWPYELSTYTNCLAFACGFNFPDSNKNIFVPPENIDIVDYVEYIFKISNLLYRKISSNNEAEKDEFIIQVRKTSFGNFHVIRRNLDGTWVHKKGWYNAPKHILEWRYIDTLFPHIACIFAVKKRPL